MGKISEYMRVFLPCRRGSVRVPNKNVRTFAGNREGLIGIKLQQLESARCFDEIIVSSNDERVLEIADSPRWPTVRTHVRNEHLSSSSTSTDELIPLVASLISDGAVLWTHVTSPFVTGHDYECIVDTYWQKTADGYDSLMTVTPLHDFIWRHNGPVNYDRTSERWPRTQELEPLYKVNSAAFVAGIDTYRNLADRVGKRPYLMTLDTLVGMDIDWEHDFAIAETMLQSGVVRI